MKLSLGEAHAHVIAELAAYTGVKKAGSGYTMVLCPFHHERTPSMRIRHPDVSVNYAGFGRCYGCGAKAAWDTLAPLLGLKPFQRPNPRKVMTTDLHSRLAFAPVEGIQKKGKLPHVGEYRGFFLKELPRGKVWRGVNTKLLRSVGGFLGSYGENKPASFIYLPVIIHGQERGYIKARLKKDPDKPSYINMEGQWAHSYGLFPFDYAVAMMKELGSTTMVLVEGARDALRLLNEGIPAVAILGTQQFTPTKARLLVSAGVERSVLFFDGDCAGKDATELVEPIIEKYMQVSVIRLWLVKGSPWLKFAKHENPSKAAKLAGHELYDPYNVADEVIDKLKAKFFKELL